MINNVNIFTIYQSLRYNDMKILQTIYKTRLISSGENEQVLNLIIKNVSSINCAQAIFLNAI